jgi:8-oxo-dGTP pyrophosphatase MutT (NUDIX family)
MSQVSAVPPQHPDLRFGDAAAAILITEDGQYLLQLRDNVPHIWYPDHWGLFGGNVEPGESEIEALRRELREELELELPSPRLFTRFHFDLHPVGLGCYFRSYYEVPLGEDVFTRLVLHEGAAMRKFTGNAALQMRLVPYDGFALFLHHQRIVSPMADNI